MSNPFISEAMKETEDEILASAFDMTPEELRGEPESDLDPEDTLGMTEGWDGDPLPDDELAATNLYGTGQNNFDRPLELEREQVWEERHQRDQQNIAALQQQVGQQALREDPVRQQQLREQQEQAELLTMSNPRDALQYMATLQQQNQQLITDRGNYTMERAYQKHGDEWMERYNALKSGVEEGNPLYLNIRNYVMSQPDAGEALMEAMSGGVTEQRANRITRSLNDVDGSYRNTPRPRSGRDDLDVLTDRAVGWQGEAQEREIWNDPDLWR
jgi:hypothetical protein